jgi:hypothetical protein
MSEAIDEFAAKLGIQKDVVEQFKMLRGESKNIQATMRLLSYQEDFLRLSFYMIMGAYGRANPEWAADAMLGLVNHLMALAQFNPALKQALPLDEVQCTNELHEDIEFLDDLIHDFKTGNIVGNNLEITSYREFLDENGYRDKYGTSNMHALRKKLSKEYKKRILELFTKAQIVLYPLASQRSSQKSSTFSSEQAPRMGDAELASTLLMSGPTAQKPKVEQ